MIGLGIKAAACPGIFQVENLLHELQYLEPADLLNDNDLKDIDPTLIPMSSTVSSPNSSFNVFSLDACFDSIILIEHCDIMIVYIFND